MEQIPSWEDESAYDGHENPGISWNPNVHYGVHNSPRPVPAFCQINPFYAPILFLQVLFLYFPSIYL
jgi:hypothetical protein